MFVKGLRRVTVCVLTAASATACATNSTPDSDESYVNPFCVVGTPPEEMVPPADEPHWAYEFLAVYEKECT